MIKAVVFDMDGVVIDSEIIHTRAIKEALKQELGLDVDKDEILEYIGLFYPEKLEKILKKRNIQKDVNKLTERAKMIFKGLTKHVRLMPGFLDLIKTVIKNNFKTALASSSPRDYIEEISSMLDIEKYFDVIIAGDEVKNRKPNPECYLLTAKKLGLKPEECLVIEDSVPGVIAAKEAGMKCIAKPNPYVKDGDFSRADMIVNSLEEIDLDTIKRFN